MKAYRIHSPRTLKLDETEALPVGDNCVKLKNLICGITPADVAVYEGRLDRSEEHTSELQSQR